MLGGLNEAGTHLSKAVIWCNGFKIVQCVGGVPDPGNIRFTITGTVTTPQSFVQHCHAGLASISISKPQLHNKDKWGKERGLRKNKDEEERGREEAVVHANAGSSSRGSQD